MGDSKLTAVLDKLKWRCIGPPRGGRVVTVAGVVGDPATYYFGACAGGVWKSNDAGQYWRNVTDGQLNTASVGAIAVAPSDPNVIYAGMGEACIRIDVSHGDGVYKSTDAGATWTHLGLEDTRHIGKIRVHPTNPDIVYVAAFGHAFGRNSQRGVYRSTDGGSTWDHILFVSDKSGAIDLILDPHNPRVLYTSIYEAYRNPWHLSSGGPDSGLYRSGDGGDTWTNLSDNPGMPEGIKGKIGVAVAPEKPGRVWALVEAGKNGLYRSENAGTTWKLVSDNEDLTRRSWYFNHIAADPVDPETVYVMSVRQWKSADGGATFSQQTTPHGDNHDLWIDPENTKRMIAGNDGGACISFNRGDSWSTIYNQMTAQFYRMATDNQFPYRVYGTQQDNSSISVPSRTGNGTISWQDCYSAGTGESGHIAVHPDNSDLVFVGAIGSSAGGGGALQKYDHKTKQIQLVTIWPEWVVGRGADAWKYRFQWTFPIRFSPHDPSILYATANVAFRSTDEGQSWEQFSPDLSYNDAETLITSGGPLNADTTGAENYGTIYSFEESPHHPGVFWSGSDDGRVHISKDNGEEWQEITPPSMEKYTLIHTLEVSPHKAGKAYLAATRYKHDDYRPYLYRTDDYGQTWTTITNGIPENDFTRVVREDPDRAGLLYAGTELGMYVSFDDGDNWHKMGGNLPVVPIHDFQRKDNDLVLATHGRAFWILDDVTLLHQAADDMAADASMHLFNSAETYRLPEPMFRSFLLSPAGKGYMVGLGTPATYEIEKDAQGAWQWTMLDVGEDPAEGVVLNYFLKDVPENGLSMTIKDEAGEVIRTFRSDDMDAPLRISAETGLNRFIWDMRYPSAAKLPEQMMASPGAVAVPGWYSAELTDGNNGSSAPFEIRKDPRVVATQQDLQKQFDLLSDINKALTRLHEAVIQIRNLREQVTTWQPRAADDSDLASAIQSTLDKLDAIEGQLIQPKAKSFMDMNHENRLSSKLSMLPSVVASADSAPTRQSYDVFNEFSGKLEVQLDDFSDLLKNGIPALNTLIKDAELPAIAV